MNNNSELVYSTEFGDTCPKCKKNFKKCRCKNKTTTAATLDGIIRVGRETKGRKGKGVTLVAGIDPEKEDIKSISKALKQKCGTGGTVKNGIIEIQGDHRDLILTELENLGFKVKKSGG
jgi:translation initiation factor 1